MGCSRPQLRPAKRGCAANRVAGARSVALSEAAGRRRPIHSAGLCRGRSCQQATTARRVRLAAIPGRPCPSRQRATHMLIFYFGTTTYYHILL
eukprot:scaffold19673_cov112-Isochrysis_galbana.AAC.3